MNRRTVGDCRKELTRLAASSGLPATDRRFYSVLNDAIEDLFHEGDFPGIVDRFNLRVSGGMIVTPGDIDRLMAVTIDGRPVEMRSPWFEYVAGGPGLQDESGWTNVVLERGEVCTFEQLPATDLAWDIAVRGEVDERVSGVRPVIIIQGYGESGRWIRSDYNGERIDGIAVAIDGDTSLKQVTASLKFRSIESIQKPATKGYVELWASLDGGALSLIAQYAPRETRPSYRRYFIPGLERSSVSSVVARCRMRFVPVENDRDYLAITNMNALKLMIRAIQKRDADEYQNYLGAKKLAVDLLKKEALSYTGKQVMPALTMSAESSIGGSIPYIV